MAESYIVLDNSNSSTSGGSAALSVTRPRVDGTKRQLREEHGGMHNMVAKYLRFMANTWNSDCNTPFERFNDNTRTHYRMSPVEEIQRNFSYYNAQQANYQFAYLQQGSVKQDTPAPWTPGHEIYQTVQHMLGPMQKVFSSAKLTVESLDPSVQSIKATKIAMIQAKKDMPAIFEKFAQMGAQFMPEGVETDMDAAIQSAMRKPAHKVERFGLDIMNHINNINSLKDFMPKRYRDCVIGKYCGIHVESHEGRIAFESPLPEALIWDRTAEDDDYNRYALYKGFISWKSREEVTLAYDFGKDATSVLDKLFDTNGTPVANSLTNAFSNLGTTSTGFSWIDGQEVQRIACVTGYFVARIVDKDGSSYYTLYKGTLIGDRVLADFGEANNIVYDAKRPEWPLAPLWIYSHDTVRGVNVCPVDRFRQLQDDCDSYLLKIRQLISSDLGKNYIIRGEALGGDAMLASTIMGDFKDHKMTVLNGANGEEPIANTKLVEMVDLTLDPNVKFYIEIRKEMIQEMRNVVSQSPITQGLQRTYIGGGTQQQTIAAASNGTVMMLQGFIQFFAMFQEYVLNVSKTMLLEAKSKDEAEMIFSEAARDFWEELKNINTQDMQVRVELEDIIDDEERAEYTQLALAALQNTKDTGFTFLDFLEVKKARTATELKRYMKERFEYNEKKKERQRAEDAKLQMVMQQNNIAAAQQQQQMKDQSSAQREVIRQTPNMKNAQTYQEEVNMEREEKNLGGNREMAFASDEGMPGTEVLS